MVTMIVNGCRYLINDSSKGADLACKKIIDAHPKDATVEFEDGWDLTKIKQTEG
jgi:hypothetical protein